MDGLVIYYQDHFAIAKRNFRSFLFHFFPARGFVSGQIDFEFRSQSGLALDGDGSAVASDDALNSSQSESSALARLFGGEERVEYSVNDFRRDAVAQCR